MFEQFKKLIGDFTASVNAPVPDLAAYPAQAVGRDFAAIPLDLISAYIGQKVVSVAPLTQFGAASGSGFAATLQQRIMDAVVAAGEEPDATGGNSGPENDEEAQLRAAMKAKMAAAAGEDIPDAWTITFEGSKRAILQLCPLGDERANFEAMRAREIAQRTRQGAQRHQDNWLDAAVRQLMDAPFESYYWPGNLLARGGSHDALVQGTFGSNHDHETLAGLAALGIRSAEGN